MAFRMGVLLLMLSMAAMAGENMAAGLEIDAHGLVEDALDMMEEEMMRESASGRRQILGPAGYISYGALNRNNVPCGRRGQSYYNCNPRQRANPYNRGCTRLTHCARNNR